MLDPDGDLGEFYIHEPCQPAKNDWWNTPISIGIKFIILWLVCGMISCITYYSFNPEQLHQSDSTLFTTIMITWGPISLFLTILDLIGHIFQYLLLFIFQ